MKQTEIGLIPDDWEVKRLGDVGEPCMCKRILKEQTSPTGDIPFYKIGTFGGIPDAYISRELFEHYKEQYVQNLNKEKVAKLLVPILNKNEQTAIAAILSDMDAELENLSAKLQKYSQLKTGMMQQLLTGKIRL